MIYKKKVRKLTLGQIIYNYCDRNSIDDFDTGNLTLLHNCYDEYKDRDDTTYRPLKVEHPLNIIRSVKLSICRSKKLFKVSKFANDYIVILKRDYRRKKLI